jgi:hypothetical protein
MAILDPSRSNLNFIDTKKYWHIVRLTLTEVFKKSLSGEEALLANELQKIFTPAAGASETREINNISIEEQILFYHTEPLYVAADLARKIPNTEQIKHYLRIAAQNSWYVNWPELPPNALGKQAWCEKCGTVIIIEDVASFEKTCRECGEELMPF